jgi:isocitrate dehydrogenase
MFVRMNQKKPITVARGDGIGPEIMEAVLRILAAADAPVEPEFIEIGEKVYLAGNSAGIDAKAWDSIRRTKILLKAPITTPQGGGYKSLNVTIRKSLGLFANVRPVQAFNPYVETHYPDMDIVIVRENEEDLYAGIEHRQTQDVTQCLKLITRPGSEKVIRYAFEYARTYKRRKVTCMIKDNIMKITDGLFHTVFDEISAEYPEIEANQQIIDIGTARVATAPERYDVIVTPNLYGDIISDVVAEVSGSVGMAGSANIGMEVSMFEAIHGSAPDIAGTNSANPSGLINAAIQMLVHIGEPDVAGRIHDAWLSAIEDGLHTADVYRPGHSAHLVGTREFADAVIERLGRKPERLNPWKIESGRDTRISVPGYVRRTGTKTLVGSDLFVDWVGEPMDASVIGRDLEKLATQAGGALKLKMITNRGVKVYPDGFPETFLTDHWRCRFVSSDTAPAGEATDYRPVRHEDITTLMNTLTAGGYEVIKTENLYYFDGERGFSLGQGE